LLSQQGLRSFEMLEKALVKDYVKDLIRKRKLIGIRLHRV
jgi:hypothetical protein